MSENQAIKTAPETSYAKGENFEILFAEFMKSDLGWDKYVIRAQQKGKANSKGSQVDIIAERQDKRGKRLQILGIGYLVIMVVFVVVGIMDGIESFIYAGLILEVAGLIALYISKDLHKENAWVECKNRKTKSTFDDVKKSIDEYKDYEASGDKEYKYIVHYFVSASGFVENALKLANDNGLVCYTYENEKFEKVTYWK